MTLVLPEAAAIPDGLPAAWLEAEPAGRMVRFTDTAWHDEASAALIAAHFPDASLQEAVPLTLRETFIAFARQFRLAATPLVAS